MGKRSTGNQHTTSSYEHSVLHQWQEHFYLRGGKEHRSLKVSQVHYVYTENSPKNQEWGGYA